MTKVTLNDVANLQNETTAVNTINSNSAVIETAFDNTLSRNGTSPNQMNAALDMNSNQIINLPTPSTVNSPARLIDVVTNPTITIPGTGTSGHTVPYLDGNNTWSGTNAFSGGIAGNTIASGTFSATKYLIGNDIVMSHPLTPNAINVANTIITLGVAAGVSLAPIPSTQYLTLIGYGAGGNITTADHITAVGSFALASFTNQVDTANTAIGVDALRDMLTGAGNVAVGEHAGTAATTLTATTSVGAQSMAFVASGANNTAVGEGALLSNIVSPLTGNENTAIGAQTVRSISAGASANTGVGFQALYSITTGTFNTAIGHRAGAAITTGGLNVCIGNAASSGGVLSSGNDNILIGTISNPADTPASNTSNYLNIGGWLKGTSTDLTMGASLTVGSATAIPAGGTSGTGLKFSSTANLGVFFGSGVPTLSAAQGSLYIRTDGSSTSTRMYVNTNGTTGWTNVTTAT